VDLHEAALQRRGKEYEFYRYDDAGHGFFYYHTPMYRPQAAARGWPPAKRRQSARFGILAYSA
jgi:carboxymethylenebutenolidase